jgi:hypothetical protein
LGERWWRRRRWSDERRMQRELGECQCQCQCQWQQQRRRRR